MEESTPIVMVGGLHRFGASRAMLSVNNIAKLREARKWKRPELARRMGTTTQQVERLEKGSRQLTVNWIDKAAAALEVPAWEIITPVGIEGPPPGSESEDSPQRALARRLFEKANQDELVQISGILSGSAMVEDLAAQQLDLVGIQQIDLAYGMGATFTDGPVESELLRFPRSWVQAITSSPPRDLTWTSGRGDSMAPTIHDGDLVLLDRSQRRILERDALWAFTVGDLGAIKRLRIKGDRVVILSDNPSVPPDEEPIEEVNIVARVIFVGKRT
jgi:phage repressor protein C with HTH and peptisase S24 domain